MDVLIRNLKHDAVATRLASLRWIYNLFEQAPRETFESIEKLFPALTEVLQDNSDEVVLAALEVFAEITFVSDRK